MGLSLVPLCRMDLRVATSQVAYLLFAQRWREGEGECLLTAVPLPSRRVLPLYSSPRDREKEKESAFSRLCPFLKKGAASLLFAKR